MAECPREALRSSLPAPAKVVLTVLWSYAGRDGGFVWPSRATLAAECGGMAERTLRTHLTKLEAERWIVQRTGENGRRGFCLCDPPGTVVHAATIAPDATHTRTPEKSKALARSGQTPADSGRSAESGQHQRPEVANKPAGSGRSHLSIGTNHEPITTPPNSTPTVQATPASAAGGGGGKLGVNAWRSEFVWTWRQAFGPAPCGLIVQDPTRDGRRAMNVQAALDDYGREVVEGVLMHAGAEVVRHSESGGRVGFRPGKLACAFRTDLPTFGVLLDSWQASKGSRRTSGRRAAAPAMLDGQPLTDAEQRAWMVEPSEVEAENAVRDLREQTAARASVGATAAIFGVGADA